MTDHLRLVRLGKSRDTGRRDSYSDTAPQVSRQIENAAGIPDLVVGQRRHGERHDRNEDQTERRSLKNKGPGDVAHAHA